MKIIMTLINIIIPTLQFSYLHHIEMKLGFYYLIGVEYVFFLFRNFYMFLEINFLQIISKTIIFRMLFIIKDNIVNKGKNIKFWSNSHPFLFKRV